MNKNEFETINEIYESLKGLKYPNLGFGTQTVSIAGAVDFSHEMSMLLPIIRDVLESMVLLKTNKNEKDDIEYYKETIKENRIKLKDESNKIKTGYYSR